jgi:hypothetical protein
MRGNHARLDDSAHRSKKLIGRDLATGGECHHSHALRRMVDCDAVRIKDGLIGGVLEPQASTTTGEPTSGSPDPS